MLPTHVTLRKRPYDEVQNAIKDELIACEKIEPLEYNGRSDYYIPLNSSYNIPVAYIIVGISTENVRREQLTYLGYITIIVTSITVLFGVFMIWFMQHNVLRPLMPCPRRLPAILLPFCGMVRNLPSAG